MTRYEERIRRLESALAEEMAAAAELAHQAAQHGALANAPTHGAVDIPEDPVADAPAGASRAPAAATSALRATSSGWASSSRDDAGAVQRRGAVLLEQPADQLEVLGGVQRHAVVRPVDRPALLHQVRQPVRRRRTARA